MMDPEAAAILRAMRADAKPMSGDQARWLRAYRAQLAALPKWQGPAPDALDTLIATPGGPLRLIRRGQGEKPYCTLLFLHGGGFVGGTLDAYDIPLRHLAIRSGWQIAALQYRLAPEHPFPAAPDDCIAALQFLAGHAAVRPDRLAVCGDSAGGLLACVTALAARDRGLPLCGQILLYPNADLRSDAAYPSRAAFDGVVIRMDELARSLDLYGAGHDRADPRLSPVLAADLSGLARTMVVTNEMDPLRDEAELLACRIRDAGCDVRHARVPGMIHGALQYAAIVRAGDALISKIAAFLIDLD